MVAQLSDAPVPSGARLGATFIVGFVTRASAPPHAPPVPPSARRAWSRSSCSERPPRALVPLLRHALACSAQPADRLEGQRSDRYRMMLHPSGRVRPPSRSAECRSTDRARNGAFDCLHLVVYLLLDLSMVLIGPLTRGVVQSPGHGCSKHALGGTEAGGRWRAIRIPKNRNARAIDRPKTYSYTPQPHPIQPRTHSRTRSQSRPIFVSLSPGLTLAPAPHNVCGASGHVRVAGEG